MATFRLSGFTKEFNEIDIRTLIEKDAKIIDIKMFGGYADIKVKSTAEAEKICKLYHTVLLAGKPLTCKVLDPNKT